MRIEDRLREALPRVTAEEQPDDALWQRVQRGVSRRRRRVIATRALGALGVILFAAALAWVALQPHGKLVHRPDRRPNHTSPVVLSNFVWAGDQVKFWKAGFSIRNRSARPVGATISCFLEDANGRRSETGTITVRFLRPGAQQTTFVVIDHFRTIPTAQHCRASVIPPMPPQPPTPIAPHFVLYRVAFWTPERGVAIGRIEARPCRDRCVAAIALTTDGGAHWIVRWRGGPTWRGSVTVLGTTDAWISFGCGAPVCFLRTTDGGKSWALLEHNEPITNPMFVYPRLGFGIGEVSMPLQATTLLRTNDAGRTWQRLANPCPSQAYQPMSVWFISPTMGWLACAGDPATADQRFKAMLVTSDGGRSWTDLHAEGLSYPGEPAPMQFFDQLHGCLWMGSGNPGCTHDGGRTWTSFDVPGFSILDSDARGWFLNERVGYSLNYLGGTLTLARTDDGGGSWHVVRNWSPRY